MLTLVSQGCRGLHSADPQQFGAVNMMVSLTSCKIMDNTLTYRILKYLINNQRCHRYHRTRLVGTALTCNTRVWPPLTLSFVTYVVCQILELICCE